MKKSVPKLVVENRRSKIIEYAADYNLTVEILADFFQVPIRTIESDINAIKDMENKSDFKLQKEGLKIFCIYFQKEEVRREVQKHIEEYGSSSRDWASVGFWMEAKQFGEAYKDIFKNVSNLHQRGILQHAYSLLKLGYTMDDTRLICSLKKVEMEILRNAMKNEKKVNQFEKWANEQYKNKKQKVDAVTVKEAVGISKIKLLKGEKYYYDVKKNQNVKPASIYVPKVTQAERDEMKEKAFLIWIYGGLKQDEIAAIFKVSRVTVGNWLREMRTKYPEEMAKYRRNVDISRRGKRRDDFEVYQTKIKPQLEAGKSKVALCEETGFSPNKILKFEKMGTDPFVSSKKETGPKDPMTMFRKKS